MTSLEIIPNSERSRIQISQTPTEWVVVKASTNSEWDACEFIVVNFSSSYFQELHARIASFNKIQNEPNLYSIAYWDAPFDWFVSNHQNESEVEEFLSDPTISWAFLKILNENEIELFEKPEQQVDGEQMRIFENGNAQFKGYGKHTSEEFWSKEFPLIEILDLISQARNLSSH